jgi:hypothetical protein
MSLTKSRRKYIVKISELFGKISSQARKGKELTALWSPGVPLKYEGLSAQFYLFRCSLSCSLSLELFHPR